MVSTWHRGKYGSWSAPGTRASAVCGQRLAQGQVWFMVSTRHKGKCGSWSAADIGARVWASMGHDQHQAQEQVWFIANSTRQARVNPRGRKGCRHSGSLLSLRGQKTSSIRP
eukprot:1160573-Pelagomonas_calceolata.AAC.15